LAFDKTDISSLMIILSSSNCAACKSLAELSKIRLCAYYGHIKSHYIFIYICKIVAKNNVNDPELVFLKWYNLQEYYFSLSTSKFHILYNVLLLVSVKFTSNFCL